MRKIEVTNDKILKLLNSKAEISKRILDCLQQQEELEKEINKNSAIHARTDEKVRPLITKMIEKVEMGEFDQISRVHQDEKDMKWYIEIVDRLEEFKAIYKEKEKNGNK